MISEQRELIQFLSYGYIHVFVIIQTNQRQVKYQYAPIVVKHIVYSRPHDSRSQLIAEFNFHFKTRKLNKSKNRMTLMQMCSIEELDEPSNVSYQKKIKSAQLSGINDSGSCEVLWDQSSKDSVELMKIKIVNNSKQITNISINTSRESFSQNIVEQDDLDIYSIFDNVSFQ
ncbi:Hypothetical_protein [Hexamita inflata]|uniref:Hypothetical_protein n=1 Tax=Hexamita inflata TaxID=28002 RepID=A0AA86U9X9_9EUKA|nr:Hypothetical protein HINF_LOCUS32086 [Hexamita inflata]